jgi:hypothetical protein
VGLWVVPRAFGFCLGSFEGCFSWVFLGFLGFFSLGLGGPVGGFWGWFGCFLGAFIVLRRLLMGVSIVWWRYYYAC